MTLFLPHSPKMASLETSSATGDVSPHFDKLLRDVSRELSPGELRNAVLSIKSIFKGKFKDQQEEDLYSCLHLFANQGLLSEDNLTLLEMFVNTPTTSKKESIQEKIQGFKTIRLKEVKIRQELTGRSHDLEKVMTRLTTGSSSVMNLYGSSGVGKTSLAIETLSKWPGRKLKADLREVNEMETVHFHVLNALIGSEQTVAKYEANPVIGQIQQLMRDGQSDILLLLDNVDQFAGGEGGTAAALNENFVTLLRKLVRLQGNSKLKILMTSRVSFCHGDSVDVDNHEVKALDKAVSSALLQTHCDRSLGDEQSREKLLEMCRGNPLILNGMAAILRQRIADDKKLLETIEQETVTEPTETGLPQTEKISQEREIVDYKQEGIDKEQENCLRKMLFFLPSKRLKESAVSVSLFSRSFSAEAAATILGVSSAEAVIQLEGLRNSKVVSVDPEAEVLSYDIHPLMRKFLRSIGNSDTFINVYHKARDRFCNHFMSQMKDLSVLLDKHYFEAFNRFHIDKRNFEFALNISLKSDHLLIPEEQYECTMIYYLFEAMLDKKLLSTIFNVWAEKAEEDGKQGSLLRAELKCREALQVLHLEGWQKALKVLDMADKSLQAIERETKGSEFFRLTQSSYLYVQGEVYYTAGKITGALRILHRSLKIMEDLLQSHTSTSRCLNAIGNCQNKLGKHDEAIQYCTRAYEMRKELSSGMNHFDMPFFKGQIGTVYEGKKEYHKAIECYKEALELAKKLKIPGMLNTALYNRNIANAYAWQGEFEEAYQPAKDAYDIRKDILGNHPWTAGSAFQMAEICRHLKDRKKAQEYYAEAWEVEKSLGQGNHSEVMVRIVESYEKILKDVRKTEFQSEQFAFYLRYWDEEREFEEFQFSLANKKIIDSINERLSDFGNRQTQEKYHREALWFYEKFWERNKAEMERQDRIDILTNLKKYSSLFKYEKKEQKYGILLKEAEQSGSHMGSLKSLLPFRSAAEQQSSDDDDDSDHEGNDVLSDHSDNHEDDSRCIDIGEQEQQLAIEVLELEEPDNSDEQDPHKIKIHEAEVSCEGDTWNLEDAAALITFHPGAVKLPLLIACSLWSPGTLSPPLGSNEVLVSNVIELSHDGPPDLEFSGDAKGNIKVALLHSASNLKGYEVVIKQFVDPENNEWKDLETINIWHTSETQAAPNWLFPFAKATCAITRYSSFAAIWRLKSYIFPKPKSVTPEFACIVPDYPDVSVKIPWNSLPADEDFYLTLKVQEFPSSELKGDGVLVGPVLDISSSQKIACVEPVTINIPLTLREGKRELGQLFLGRLRILHSDSGDESHTWEDITEQLKEPAVIVDGIVKFEVKHFSRFMAWITLFPSAVKHLASVLIPRSMPQDARFLACLCKTNVPGNFVLTVYCYPNILQNEVDKTLAKYDVRYQGQTNSLEPLCKGDRILVSLSEALIRQDTEMENAFVRFLGNEVFDLSGSIVCVRSDSVPQVKFFKSQECQQCEQLCKVTMVPTPSEFPQYSFVPISSEAARERQRIKETSHSNRTSLSSEAVDRVGVFPKRVLQVTLLASEWRSSKGGLSTINRELAKQLSANPEVKVTLFVPQSACGEDDKEIASSHGISIVEAKERPGFDDPLDWLSCPPDDLIIDVLVGHGVKLGRQAKDIKKRHQCKWVQMVHTVPDQLAMYKSYPSAISRGEEKNLSEVGLCEEADLVVTIGPKLKEAVLVSLRSCEKEDAVFSITPGTFLEFYCVRNAPVDTERFYVLAYGRCDLKDLKLKGYDIAAKAMAELDDKSYHLTVLGATDGKQEELVENLVGHGISRCQLTINTFCKDRKMLGKLFAQKDLVIMPSRTEGFGLTGLEALSAGLPILVSGNSGFAEALQKVPFGDSYVVADFENAKEWAKKIRAVRQKDRTQRYEEIKKLRTFYEDEYSWEKQCEVLVAKMSSMVYGWF